MTPIQRKIQVLEIVARGGTLDQAGKSVGVGAVRARSMLSALCRTFRMSSTLDNIRARPEEYIRKAKILDSHLKATLGRQLVNKLVLLLDLEDETFITPEHLSTYSRAELIRKGVSSRNVSKLEHSLLQAGRSLK